MDQEASQGWPVGCPWVAWDSAVMDSQAVGSSLSSDTWMLPGATERGKSSLQGSACDPTAPSSPPIWLLRTHLSIQPNSAARLQMRKLRLRGWVPHGCQTAAKVEIQTHSQFSILSFSLPSFFFHKPTKCAEGLPSSFFFVFFCLATEIA